MKSQCARILCLVVVSRLGALPEGLHISSGAAALDRTPPQELRLQVADRSILNWDQFSIATNEQVAFVLPDAASCVLNRVVGSEASCLAGFLSSNGRVVLINPQGIFFGPDAQVNVASLVASTLDLPDEIFLNQDEWRFSGTAAGCIQNLGSIETSAGDLILIAPRIENQGSLQALHGTVGIGAGADVFVSPKGIKHVFVQPSDASAFADQSGTIVAARVEMQIDGNPYSLAFRHSGSMDALGMEVQNGEIFLSVPQGDAILAGSMKAEQGRIEIGGQRIGIKEGAQIDASGASGGTILIGGDYRGNNPAIQNAEALYIEPGASIRSDGLQDGNGGRIILWSDRSTQMHGQISAQGGPSGGDGGLVEISSRGSLECTGVADLRSPHGQPGTLLFDPTSIAITGATAGVALGNCGFPATTYASNVAAGTLLASGALSLSAQLGLSNVVITTYDGTCGPFADTGDVTISSAVSWTSGNSLTILAYRHINCNASVTKTTASVGGNITFVAGWDGVTLGPIFPTGSYGNNGGDVFVDNVAAAVTVSSTSGTLNFLGRDVQLLTKGGAMAVTASGAAQSINCTAARDVIVRGADTVAASCNITAASGLITFSASRDIDVRADLAAGASSVTISSLGPTTFNAGRDILCQSGAENNPLTISTTGLQNVNFTAQQNIIIADLKTVLPPPPPNVYDMGNITIQSTGMGDVNLNAVGGVIQIYSPTDANGTNAAGTTLIGSTTTTQNVNLIARDQILLQAIGSLAAPSGSRTHVEAANSAILTTTGAAGSIAIMGTQLVGASSFGSRAGVTTVSGPIALTSQSVSLLGGRTGSATAFLQSTSGNISVAASSGNITMTGGPGNQAHAFIATAGSVAVNVPLGSLLMTAQSNASNASIDTSSGTGSVSIALGSNLTMTRSSNGTNAKTLITSNSGAINVNVLNHLTMLAGGVAAGPNCSSSIVSTSGNVTVAVGGDISMAGTLAGATTGSSFTRIGSTSGIVNVSARNLTMTGGQGMAVNTDCSASIRSLTGAINVTLSGDLTMTGGFGNNTLTCAAQIGWRTVAEAATAPIFIDVGGIATLTGTTGGVSFGNSAQIGHGSAGSSTGSANANINIVIRNGANNPTALSLFGNNSIAPRFANAQIGHGGPSTTLSSAAGNIQVTVARGDVLMRGGSDFDPSHIGHHTAAAGSTVLGAIALDIQSGNLSVIPPTVATSVASPAGIFHFSPSVLAGSSIQVAVNGNVSLAGGRQTSIALIGAQGTLAGGVSLDPPVIVCVSGNLTLGSSSGIGLAAPGAPLTLAIGDVMVQVDGTVSLVPTATGTGNGEHIAFIGTPNAQSLGAGPFSSNVFLAVGGDLLINGDTAGTDAANNNAEVYGLNDANIGVVGDVYVRGGNDPAGIVGPNNSRIGSRLQTPLSTVRLWAGGDILFQNNSLGGFGVLGSGIAGQGGSIDARSAGDLHLATNVVIDGGAPSASILIAGGSSFAAGDLFSSSPTNVLTVAGQTASGFLCATTASSAIGPDVPFNQGSVVVDTRGYPSTCPPFGVVCAPTAAASGISVATINGNLTIHSADRYQTTDANAGTIAGDCSNLLLAGAGVNRLVPSSTTGNIEIAGPSPTDSFNNILITAPAAVNPWTAGTILVSANNDLTIDTTVSTSGAGSFITLRADNNDSNTICPSCPSAPGCVGVLTINSDVTTNAGPITLDSGFGPSFGTSSINQISGTVNSNGGAIRTQAVGNITISGNPTSMTSGIGNQSMESTVGTIFIEEDIVSTSGAIDLLAVQQDIFIQGGGSVSSASGPISLTAGNDIDANGDPTSIFSTTGSINSLAEDDTRVTTNVNTAGFIQMVSGNHMFLFGTADITSSGSSVTLVVDQDFPTAPLIGAGSFNFPATASINAAAQLRIFTAIQSYNTILGSITVAGNPLAFVPGTLFVNTPQEVWCTYFNTAPAQTSPFTVYYKNCLQQATVQATIIIDQVLVTLAKTVDGISYNWPYYGINEYYGWPSKFLISYDLYPKMPPYKNWPAERYFLNRRNDLLVHPIRSGKQ